MKKLLLMALIMVTILSMLPGAIHAQSETQEHGITASEVKFQNDF